MFKVKLTKLASSHNELRENEIDGVTEHLPVVGENFVLYGEGLSSPESIRRITTTPVMALKEIDNSTVKFWTQNSIYKLAVVFAFDLP